MMLVIPAKLDRVETASSCTSSMMMCAQSPTVMPAPRTSISSGIVTSLGAVSWSGVSLLGVGIECRT
eukprot:2718807-Rhodomonas_salina.1